MDGLSLLYTIRMVGLGNEEHGWTISGADTGFRPGGWGRILKVIKNLKKVHKFPKKGQKILSCWQSILGLFLIFYLKEEHFVQKIRT